MLPPFPLLGVCFAYCTLIVLIGGERGHDFEPPFTIWLCVTNIEHHALVHLVVFVTLHIGELL